MSTAPNHALGVIHDEIALLRDSQRALREAVAVAERGRDATQADLLAVQKRLTDRTGEALPHDEAIRKRIATAIESAFTTALRALTARWNEIVELLTKACQRVDEALREAERRLQQRDEAVRLARQRAT
ncbi:hypothetical protein [Jiangella rhizosphaerae]|uniref:Uncharacterized protein n=1 Tax=Jiangella rhizosphaerae TaxID=2293569 RepID=A0A418KVP7_9ACTN|nr:hypothetical protein [Jiangella rhizosphaerae]RIQ33624.1 hypothetical protein DY240_04965 [Jiangella rhizosphaerae]